MLVLKPLARALVMAAIWLSRKVGELVGAAGTQPPFWVRQLKFDSYQPPLAD